MTPPKLPLLLFDRLVVKRRPPYNLSPFSKHSDEQEQDLSLSAGPLSPKEHWRLPFLGVPPSRLYTVQAVLLEGICITRASRRASLVVSPSQSF